MLFLTHDEVLKVIENRGSTDKSLQPIVAVYRLRLNEYFGITRVEEVPAPQAGLVLFWENKSGLTEPPTPPAAPAPKGMVERSKDWFNSMWKRDGAAR